MMKLFDQEEVFDIYVENREREAEKKKAIQMAEYLVKNTDLPISEIAKATELSEKKVEKLKKDLLQPI